MAIAVSQGHVDAAINFVKNNSDNVYLELAKSNNWSNPEVPDVEVPNISDLQGSLGFVKAQQVLLVYDGGTLDSSSSTKEDTSNTVIYQGRNWLVTDYDNASTNNARYVLIKGVINPSDLPDMTFYQTGIRLNTKYADNVSTKVCTTPDYVIDKGTLIAYENHKSLSLNNQVKMEIKYLLKF